MKMPVMLRSTHEEVVTNFESKLVVVYEEKARLNDELEVVNKSNEYLQNRNSELSTKLTVAEKKIDARGNTIEELEKELKELRFCNQEAKKEINRLKSMLKVNGIAKQQLREMCLYKDGKGRYVKSENEVLVNEKVNGLKVWDLTVLLGE